jgi:hypothetical protein
VGQDTIVFVQGQQDGMENGAKLPAKDGVVNMKNGLYANIHAKQERIKHGSGEHMNKVGSKNAPTAKDFKESAKTAKPQSRKDVIREKMKDM